MFLPYYDRIAAWFWGHEHNLVIFKDNQLFGGTMGLRKGRLVGCSAYEEMQSANPYDKDPACAAVEYADHMPRLHVSQYKSPTQTFYNHAFTLLEIAPAKIVAKYFEYPSWDQDYKPNPGADGGKSDLHRRHSADQALACGSVTPRAPASQPARRTGRVRR